MKQIYFMFALLATILFTVNLNNASPVNDVEKTIRGTVEAVNWGDDDKVTEVAISVVVETVENEGETEDIVEYYYVNNKGKGVELLKNVGAEVEATGMVTTVETDEESYKEIAISSYKILKPAPAVSDDEEEEEPQE